MDTPDDWFAVHSVGLTSHAFKSWAEADFVLIAPFGLVCLEVKGGVITADGGRWATNGTPLSESPFEQAGGEAAALRRDLRSDLPGLRTWVEYGVMFPDCVIDVRGPGTEQAITFDGRDADRSMRRYLDRLFAHWTTVHGDRGHRPRLLSRGDRSLIASWLAPSITSIPSFRARLAQAETEFADMTERQAMVMRTARTEPRFLVRGGAGTGKTMLAVYEAEILASRGMRTLLLCRSSQLAEYIRGAVSGVDGLVVADIRTIAQRTCDAYGAQLDADADDTDLATLLLPTLAAEQLALSADPAPFDALVIDEAQDLLLPAIIDFLDVLIAGGIDKGFWRVFLDHKQDVFSGLNAASLERIRDASTSRAELVDNCRNTPEIAISTALASATPIDEVNVSSGPEVVQRFVDGSAEEAAAVRYLLAAWSNGGVPGAEIVVLGSSVSAPPHLGDVIHGIDADIRWSAIDDFKGLEAAAVVVTGLDDFDNPGVRRRAYVGYSRARWLLGLVFPSRAQESLARRARGFGERMLAAGAGSEAHDEAH